MTAPHRKTSVSCLEISQDALGSDPIHSASPDLCKGAATDTSISFPPRSGHRLIGLVWDHMHCSIDYFF